MMLHLFCFFLANKSVQNTIFCNVVVVVDDGDDGDDGDKSFYTTFYYLRIFLLFVAVIVDDDGDDGDDG